MMWWIPAAISAVGTVASMIGDDDESSSSSSESEESSTEVSDPWSGITPYLTGIDQVPSYLYDPIPETNNNWQQWANDVAAGQRTSAMPKQFLTPIGESYGRVPAEAALTAPAQTQGQTVQYGQGGVDPVAEAQALRNSIVNYQYSPFDEIQGGV